MTALYVLTLVWLLLFVAASIVVIVSGYAHLAWPWLGLSALCCAVSWGW